MNIVELGQLLEQEQIKLARDALSSPSDRDGFEYGRVCGIYAGLALAWSLIRSKHQEQQEKDDKL